MTRINRCPVCGSDLTVRVLECKVCGTRIEGEFVRSPFEMLDDDQVEFLMEFLRVEGNFSELARKMGLSFPTVKARFYSILETLGIQPKATKRPTPSEVLNMLERGDITVEEAEQLLRGKR